MPASRARRNTWLDVADDAAVIDFCKNNAVELVVVGPELRWALNQFRRFPKLAAVHSAQSHYAQQPRQMLLIFFSMALSAGSRGGSTAGFVESGWPAAAATGCVCCLWCLASADSFNASAVTKTMHRVQFSSFCKSSPRSCRRGCSPDRSCRHCPFRPSSSAGRCRPQGPCLVRSRANPMRLPSQPCLCRAPLPLSVHCRCLLDDWHLIGRARGC